MNCSRNSDFDRPKLDNSLAGKHETKRLDPAHLAKVAERGIAMLGGLEPFKKLTKLLNCNWPILTFSLKCKFVLKRKTGYFRRNCASWRTRFA